MTSFALTVTNGYSSDMSVDTGKVGTNGYCGYDGAMTIRPGETKEGMQWTDPDAASNCDVPFTDSHGFDTVVRVLFPEYGEPLLEVIQNAKIDGPSAVTIVDWSP